MAGSMRSRRNHKHKAALWLQSGEWVGIIVPSKTGFVFTNQTGGVMCHHPELEGTYVPLPPYFFDEQRRRMVSLSEYVPGRDIGAEEADIIRYIKDAKLKLTILDRKENEEAWLWIRVGRVRDKDDPLYPLSGMEGVLTYPNSD